MLEEKEYVDIIGAHFSAGAGGCGNLPEGEITEDNRYAVYGNFTGALCAESAG